MRVNKKILIISASFYPKNSPRSFRTTELVKEFCRKGHEVTIIAPIEAESIELAKELSFNYIDIGKITWPTFSSKVPLAGKLNRLLSWIFEYPKLQYSYNIFKLRNSIKGFDLLISIAVPYTIHWGVALIWKKNRNLANTWVADCGDPYMGQENDSVNPPFYFEQIERWFMKKADFICIPTENAKSAYYKDFHNKIVVIPQGFKFSDIPQCAEEVNSKIPTSTNFAYAGSLIPGKRLPIEFFEHLIRLKDDYRFYIYTNQKSLLIPYELRSEGRIILKDTLPRLTLLKELCKMDFVVNFENAGQAQQPSKLIDYALINRPILSVSTIDYNDMLIKQFLSKNYKERVIVRDIAQYNISNVCSSFLKLEST